jgi:hypothetical protein
MAYGRAAAKKSPTAPWGGHGSRAAKASGPTRALAHPVHCVFRLRGLSSSIQVLAFRRLICFAEGPQPPCECPAQPTRRPLAASRTYSERSLSGCQEKCSIFDSSQSWGYRRLAHFPPPSSEAPGAEGNGPSKACPEPAKGACPEPAEGGAPVGADFALPGASLRFAQAGSSRLLLCNSASGRGAAWELRNSVAVRSIEEIVEVISGSNGVEYSGASSRNLARPATCLWRRRPGPMHG